MGRIGNVDPAPIGFLAYLWIQLATICSLSMAGRKLRALTYYGILPLIGFLVSFMEKSGLDTSWDQPQALSLYLEGVIFDLTEIRHLADT